MKKVVLTLVTGSLLASSFSPLVVSASSLEGSSSEVLTETVSANELPTIETENSDLFIEEVEPYIYKTMQGTIEIGNYPESFSSTYSNEIESLEAYLAPLNQQVLDGTLRVTDDLAFAPTAQLRAAGNGATIYWWGYQYVFNKSQGLNFAKSMEDLSYGTLSMGSFLSMFGLAKIGAPLGALGGPYYKQIAKKVREKVTSKGVIINITHVAVFTVKSR